MLKARYSPNVLFCRCPHHSQNSTAKQIRLHKFALGQVTGSLANSIVNQSSWVLSMAREQVRGLSADPDQGQDEGLHRVLLAPPAVVCP